LLSGFSSVLGDERARGARDTADVTGIEPAYSGAKADLPLQELTYEVRWVRPGRVGSDIAEWFARFSHVSEVREDHYLVTPPMPGLSVKIRGGSSLDVKQRLGAVGALEVEGVGAAQISSWSKLSFLLADEVSPTPEEPAWRRVAKRRMISTFPIGRLRRSESVRSSACSVELTEVEALDDTWWTLAFESRGRRDVRGIRRTAAMVFAEPLPVSPPLRAEEAQSYAEWIHRLSNAGGTT